MTPELKGFLLIATLKILVVFTAIMLGVMFTTWLERRVSAWFQYRLGPNRVGPQGLLQPVADGVKNFAKEESLPGMVDRPLFLLAPALTFVPALLLFCVVPFGAPLPVSFDFTLPVLGRFVHAGATPMMIADLPVGFLFILAVSSLGVYGIVLAGWASNSKYAFLGGLRASAQMVSYEIALGMSLISVMIVAGSVTLTEVVAVQQQSLWLVFPLTFAFILFAIAALAETNRLPFDMPETESELVTGYHTEYSAMRFSMFFIGEYGAIITMSALMATFFFGGWDIPFTTWDDVRMENGVVVAGTPTVLKSLLTNAVFVLKTFFFVFWYVWVRWTLPRFRFDQLMTLGWKILLPLALAYIVVVATTVLVLLGEGGSLAPAQAWVMFVVNLVVLVLVFGILDRGRLISGPGARLRRIGGAS
jgi:NADH-quinone oxidoreductase subunit H